MGIRGTDTHASAQNALKTRDLRGEKKEVAEIKKLKMDKRKEVPIGSDSESDSESGEEKEVNENNCFICGNDYAEAHPKIDFSVANDDCKKAGHSACSTCVLKIAMGNKKCPFCRRAMKKKAKKPKVPGVARKGVEKLARELMLELRPQEWRYCRRPEPEPTPEQQALLQHQELISAAQLLLGPMEDKSFDDWNTRVGCAAIGIEKLDAIKSRHPGAWIAVQVPLDLATMQPVARGSACVDLTKRDGADRFCLGSVPGDAFALFSRRQEVSALAGQFRQAKAKWEAHVKNATPLRVERRWDVNRDVREAEFAARRDANYAFLCAQDPRFRQPVKADGKPLAWQFTVKDFITGYDDDLGTLVRGKVLKMNDKVLLEAPWF